MRGVSSASITPRTIPVARPSSTRPLIRANSVRSSGKQGVLLDTMAENTLTADRVSLIPYSPEHLLALIEGHERFRQCFGLPAADGLRTFIVSDEVSPTWLARLRASVSADPWLHGFAVVDRQSQSVIGGVGFKGPPDEDGMVEIAYGIVPAFQGRGYAT